jgi:beta-glucosidase
MEDGIIGVTIQNPGEREGRQVVQLYVEQPGKTVPTALRELKGFVKVHLLPEERKRVQFILTRRDFSYFDERISDWVVEGGLYRISLGFSSRELLHTIEVDIRQYMPKRFPLQQIPCAGMCLQAKNTQTFSLRFSPFCRLIWKVRIRL